jgi:hypothetical protein
MWVLVQFLKGQFETDAMCDRQVPVYKAYIVNPMAGDALST